MPVIFEFGNFQSKAMLWANR